jgi:NAD(P)-dependent dehydrogenase (short-subunit alcohol dehydrogenase family)
LAGLSKKENNARRKGMGVLDFFNLAGKVGVVTGAAQGLGREIALALAQTGASLVLADVADTGATTQEIEKAGSPCIVFRTDISDESSVRNLANQAFSRFKRIDILVNNAGISQLSYVPTEDAPVEEWDRVIAVNLRGTYLCCKYFGKYMIEQGGGSIVNVSTTAGITGVPRAPAYCASKAGVILLTKSLALEWAKYHVRVNAVAPHYLETELTTGLRASEKAYTALVGQIPMRRFGKTSELLGSILLLCSEASSYMTGSVLVVDGGYLAQ